MTPIEAQSIADQASVRRAVEHVVKLNAQDPKKYPRVAYHAPICDHAFHTLRQEGWNISRYSGNNIAVKW